MFSRSEIIKIIVKLSVWLKQFYIILTRGKKRLSLNVFGELAEKSIFWWRIVSSCVTLLDKIWKNLASDFFGPKLKFRKVKKIPSFHMLLVGNVKLTLATLLRHCAQHIPTEMVRKGLWKLTILNPSIWNFEFFQILKKGKSNFKSIFEDLKWSWSPQKPTSKDLWKKKLNFVLKCAHF